MLRSSPVRESMPPNAMKDNSFDLNDLLQGSDEPVIEKSFDLPPMEGYFAGLGIFPNSEEPPHFEQSLEPDIKDELGVSAERLPVDKDHYLLLYQFHNFGGTTCKVTLQRTDKKPHQKDA
ncbi:hypothetical protein [Streptomyces sp. NPDC048489]|uniref:hypothetical protein n=1 Tax=Streptomyces sp. NPDC048489 TaxID=3154504 RepID=UPI00342AC9CE